MKFTIERADLVRIMTHVSKAVESRNTMPILSSVLLTATDGRLVVAATDLDIEATASAEAAVDEPGAVCVTAKLLADIARKATGAVSFELVGAELALKSGRSKFKLQTLPAADFPTFGVPEFESVFEHDLGALFAQVAFAMSSEETRYYLNGVYLAAERGTLTAVATDGHRLAKAVADSDAAFPGVIVPRKAVALTGDGMAAVSVSSNKIRIVQGDTTLTSKLIDGTFPDYERVIPTGNDKVVTVDRDAMMKAADRVVTISDEKGRAVKLSITPGAIELSARSGSGTADDEVEAEYSGPPVEIGFNSRYLAEMFGSLPAGPMTIAVVDNMAPALIKSAGREGWVGVAMPMRVS